MNACQTNASLPSVTPPCASSVVQYVVRACRVQCTVDVGGPLSCPRASLPCIVARSSAFTHCDPGMRSETPAVECAASRLGAALYLHGSVRPCHCSSNIDERKSGMGHIAHDTSMSSSKLSVSRLSILQSTLTSELAETYTQRVTRPFSVYDLSLVSRDVL